MITYAMLHDRAISKFAIRLPIFIKVVINGNKAVLAIVIVNRSV